MHSQAMPLEALRRSRFLAAVCAVVLASLVSTAGALAWTWPADGPVLRPFSVGPDPYAGGQHRGVDIGAQLGSVVVAPAGGTVSFVGFVPGGGHAVTIATDDGYAVTLLQLGATSVERGSTLTEGAEVGAIGESSDTVTLQPHVHLGVRVAADPNGYVDPLGLLPARLPAPVSAFTGPRAARGRSASSRRRRDPGAAAHTARGSGLRAGRGDVGPRRCRYGLPRRAPHATCAHARRHADARDACESAAPDRLAGVPEGCRAGEDDDPRRRATAPARTRLRARRRSATVSPPAITASRPVGAKASRRASRPVRAQPIGAPRDAVRPSAGVAAPAARRGERGPAGSILVLTALALAAGVARRVRRRPVPIMAGDELLPDNTDLLRQLDAAHRPRVHDDRGRHSRAPSPPARRGDVLPHRGRRARGQGRAGSCGAGARAPGVRRPDRRRLAGAAAARQRVDRLLHQDDR